MFFKIDTDENSWSAAHHYSKFNSNEPKMGNVPMSAIGN